MGILGKVGNWLGKVVELFPNFMFYGICKNSVNLNSD